MGTQEPESPDNDSMEVWCICRVVKPNRPKEGKPTNQVSGRNTNCTSAAHGSDSASTPTPTPSEERDTPALEADGTDTRTSEPLTQPDDKDMDAPLPRHRTSSARASICSTDSARMSESSVNLDCLDFDASFSSFKSTDTMEQEDLADQLSLVQQMVVEMKQGFATAMEELSKIQYGDQNLQTQLADNKRECSEEIGTVRRAVEDLKTEVEKLCEQLRSVSDTQQGLQQKIAGYQSDRDILLEELEKSGAISDQIRLQLSGGVGRENNNDTNNNSNDNTMPDVAPMVHPYLDSLQNHRGPEDQYNSDSSLTAAVTRSLSLTQALGEKCLQLDFSTTSSDDEDHSRNSSNSQHRPAQRHASFAYEEGGHHGQKVPPHEKVMEEVHREEAARDVVEAEREYCSQVWILVDTYMHTLKQEEIIPARELHTLFPAYIPHIYEQHCIMLRKLEDRMSKWKMSGVIGDIFAKLTDAQDGDGLSLYKDYINDFPAMINGMNRWFAQSAHFREIMQSPCLATAPVLPLMLAPLQQVPKYSLLLKNIVKYTPADHPDRYYLESSLTKLKLFLNMMNDDLEQAMHVLNISQDPINRSRESGNSVRSRSSGSSGEVNHMSSTRDSGIHSNGEDQSRSPMSPATTRRFVLQVLREKREREAEMHERSDGYVGTPRGRKQKFGSHPDLASQLKGVQEGRNSPHLSTLPQSKMFSSLSKLPLPQDKGKKVRVKKRQEGQHPGINPNYLRPLTPQVFQGHFDGQVRRRSDDYRQRMRPQSAMEYSTDSAMNHDRWMEMMADQQANSPRHSSGSERSRKDLHLSLQKLLAETNSEMREDSDQDQEEEHVSSYHRQYLATRDKILRRGSDRDRAVYNTHYTTSPPRAQDHRMPSAHSPDDYGIYGDDDEVEEEFEHAPEVKPMKLLPDTHRPKIMVPRWRQNASPHPPSYSSSVDVAQRQSHEFTSEENLAASLAQSLSLEGNRLQSKSETLPKVQRVSAPTTNSTGSLKRRLVQHKDHDKEPIVVRRNLPVVNNKDNDRPKREIRESPKRELRRASDIRPRTPTSPMRDLSAATQLDSKVKRSSVDKGRALERSSESNPTSDTDNVPPGGGVSTAMLTDVIAYTADCLERSDNKVQVASGSDSDSSVDDDSIVKVPSTIVRARSNDTVSNSVPLSSSAAVTLSSSSSPIQSQQPLVFSSGQQMSPPDSGGESSSSPTRTDSLVYYFQNRKQLNKPAETAGNSNFPSSVVTSSPNRENRPFDADSSGARAEDSFSSANSENPDKLPVVRKDTGRKDEMKKQSEGIEDRLITTSNSMSKRNMNGETPVNNGTGRLVGNTNKSVDRLKQSFEKKNHTVTFSATESQQEKSTPRPHSGKYDSPRPPLALKTFSLPENGMEKKSEVPSDQADGGDGEEGTQRMYRKAATMKTAGKYLGEASARQISKLERSVSPTGFQGQQERGRAAAPTGPQGAAPKPNWRGNSPQRPVSEGSLIPKRTLSPPRSLALNRPLTPQGPLMGNHQDSHGMNGDTPTPPPLKSSLKDTKIPVLRKSSSGKAGTFISKSTEDISKMKKKSAFKDSLKHIFGRKKKKSRTCSNGLDLEEDFGGFVDMETVFMDNDIGEILSFPLSERGRSHSTSHILQNYRFDEDDPVSAV